MDTRTLPRDGTPLKPSPWFAERRAEGPASPLTYADGHDGMIVTGSGGDHRAQRDLPRDGPPAVVGFDNGALARLIRPRPTFIEQPVEELAHQAAGLLLERVGGQTPDQTLTITLDAALVLGHESTYAMKPRESVR